MSTPPAATASMPAARPSSSVDLPQPFSPTRKVTGAVNSSSPRSRTSGSDQGNVAKSGVCSGRRRRAERKIMDQHTIRGTGVTAIVKADGAELCSLRNAAGHELLWQALPAWPRHAPLLFPIVGRLKDDRLRHRGREYRLTQHGFARDRRFAWAHTTSSSCRLVLE